MRTISFGLFSISVRDGAPPTAEPEKDEHKDPEKAENAALLDSSAESGELPWWKPEPDADDNFPWCWSSVVVPQLLLVFLVFSARIFLPFSWGDDFIPVVSPLYRQQEAWLWSGVQPAVYAHVASGMICFVCILLQVDKPVRNARPDLHRLCGRVYVVAGCVCVLSLRQLRGTTGAGSDPKHRADLAMVCFIDAASLIWVGSTAVALYQIIITRDHSSHRRWMTVSMSVMFVPVIQRIISYFILVPLFMFLRGLVVVLRFSQPPWEARWGNPGSTWTLVWDPPATSTQLETNPRASPYIWNFEGYGEAEQASFWLTAWMGLFVVVGIGYKHSQVHDARTAKAQMLQEARINWFEPMREEVREWLTILEAEKTRVGTLAVATKGAFWFGCMLAFGYVAPWRTVLYWCSVAGGGALLVVSVSAACVGFVAVVFPIYVVQLIIAAGYGSFTGLVVAVVALQVGIVGAFCLFQALRAMGCLRVGA